MIKLTRGTGLIAKEHARAISMIRDSATLVAAADIDSQRRGLAPFKVPHHSINAQET